MSTADRVKAAIDPVLAPLGLVIEDITVTQAGKRRQVRVLVDTDLSGLDLSDVASPVPTLSLDTVADATRAVSDALDLDDVMALPRTCSRCRRLASAGP